MASWLRREREHIRTSCLVDVSGNRREITPSASLVSTDTVVPIDIGFRVCIDVIGTIGRRPLIGEFLIARLIFHQRRPHRRSSNVFGRDCVRLPALQDSGSASFASVCSARFVCGVLFFDLPLTNGLARSCINDANPPRRRVVFFNRASDASVVWMEVVRFLDVVQVRHPPGRPPPARPPPLHAEVIVVGVDRIVWVACGHWAQPLGWSEPNPKSPGILLVFRGDAIGHCIGKRNSAANPMWPPFFVEHFVVADGNPCRDVLGLCPARARQHIGQGAEVSVRS